MQNKTQQTAKGQGITLRDREVMHVSGVDAVDRFDETTVLLDTALGRLRIDGSGLHLQKLDLDAGQVIVQGQIDAAVYEKGKSAKGFFERIFA